MMFSAILLAIIIIIGIITVQNRFETEGLGRAFKSLIYLFLALIGCLLCFSGIGAVIGIPIIGCIAKELGKRV